MWILVLLGAAAFIVLWWWLSQPVKHRSIRLGQLESFLAALLARGEPGSFLIAKHEGSPRFIQFALNSADGDTVKFELGVPDTTWSRHFFDGLRARATEAGFWTMTDEGKGEGDVAQLLRVVVAGPREESAAEGVRLIELVQTEMGLSADDTFTVEFGGNFVGQRSWQDLDRRLSESPEDGPPRWFRRWVERRANRP